MRTAAILAGVVAVTMAVAADAQTLGSCIWSRLSKSEQTRVLAAYQRDMPSGATALETLDAKVRADAAACAGRRDIPPLWTQTIAGSEAVQESMAAALAANRVDRARLDAAWKTAPAEVAACVRANGRLAFSPNALGCANPAATQWVLRQAGAAPGEPAARQAVYFFNAKAIGEWGDKLVGQLKR